LITSGQIRAARAFLKWTGADLAKFSGVAFSTLMRLESAQGVPNANIKTLTAIKKTFEEHGIEFIGTPEDAPGVRLRT
jgi:transcriptional regulator with XRE-family HTH domain